jgi:regulatory protein
VPPEAAESVLARFEEVGLVDDAAFAQAWVTSRAAGRGLGRRRLAGELRQRGVDAETVSDAVAALEPDDERTAALAWASRRAAALRGLPLPTQRRRLADGLARRGYPGALVHAVVAEVTSDTRDEVPSV